MRAYVAHAKQTCRPIIEDDGVAERLKQFFVEFRTGAGEQNDDSPVPVTFRKVEAIQRLAESSARVRLSDTVELGDVERAIKLVTKSMKQVGYDPERDKFDADIIETGQSKSQRQRRETILELINEWESTTVEQLSMASEGDSSSIEYEIQKLKDNVRVYSMDGVLRRA